MLVLAQLVNPFDHVCIHFLELRRDLRNRAEHIANILQIDATLFEFLPLGICFIREDLRQQIADNSF